MGKKRGASRLAAAVPNILFLVFAAILFAALLGCSGAGAGAGEQPISNQQASEQLSDSVPAQKSKGVPAVPSGSTDGDSAASDEPATVENELVVRFIDVGQGDCALITCGGQSLLVDGGPPDASSKIYSILRDFNISELDCVIATHPDADHVGGILGALNATPCKQLFCSTTQSDTSIFTDLQKAVQQQGVSIAVPTRGDRISVGDASVTLLTPLPAAEQSGDNNNSLVVRIDHGANSFLFMADAENELENALLAAGANIETDVLKVAHHGSKSSSSLAFIRAVSPRYAVISVGENSYGHPSDVVLANLQKAGAEVFRTDLVGAVIVRSDGKDLSVTTTTGVVYE